MSKHTAGPWEIKKSPFEVYNVDHGSLTHEICAGDIMLAALYADPESSDAGLIAAAPDLLEALEQAASDLFYQISNRHGERAAYNYPPIVNARAAITKAKGEAK